MTKLQGQLAAVVLCLTLFASSVTVGLHWRQEVIPVPPDPVPIGELVVLIVEETADRNKLSRETLAVLTSTELRDWLDQHDAQFRIWDQHTQSIGDEEALFRELLDLPRSSLPWIHASNGRNAFSGPITDLPQTISDLEALDQ